MRRSGKLCEIRIVEAWEIRLRWSRDGIEKGMEMMKLNPGLGLKMAKGTLVTHAVTYAALFTN